MARIRTIKPDFFRHEGLQDLAAQHGAHVMLVFAGLWGHCDRFGRFECRPRHLKLDILPFLDFDMAETIQALEGAGFIQTYEVGSKRYGFIPSFAEHQRFGGKEASEPAKYPEPPVKTEGSNGEATGKQSPPLEWNKGMENGIREREGNGEDAREQVLASPEPEIEPLPVSKAKKPKAEVVKGTRWHPDNCIPDEWLDAASEARGRAGLTPVDMRHEVVKFSHYWASPDAKNPMKKDWRQTFINWILNAKGAGNGTSIRQSGATSLAGEVFGNIYAQARAQREFAGE